MEDNKKIDPIELQEKELSALEMEIQESGWKRKDTFYFGHDFNARNDPKCRALMRKHQIAGYGVFWIIIEMLRAESNFELPYNDYIIETIAEECRIDPTQAKEIINFCIEIGLLVTNDEESFFWSWSLKGRMIPNEKTKLGRSKGGKNSAGKPKSKKKESTPLSTEISTTLSDNQENGHLIQADTIALSDEQLSVDSNEISFSKEKKIKEKESKEKEIPIIVSRAREDEKIESDLMKKARGLKDFLLKRESSAGLAVSGG